MLRGHVTLLALLMLTACYDVEVEPGPAPGPVLAAGPYDLLVRDVVAMDCAEDPGVMRGQVLPAELAIGEEGVTFTFAGWVLRGSMEPGNLHVEGLVDASRPEPVEDDEVEETDEDDGDGDGDTDTDSGEEVVDEDDAREPVEHEGRPEGDPREPRASALLDATIREVELAEGSLFISVPDCEVELSVVIGRGGRPDHPHDDEPTEPPEEPREGEERPDEGEGGSDEGREG